MFGEHVIDISEALDEFLYLYTQVHEDLERIMSTSLQLSPATLLLQLNLFGSRYSGLLHS